VKALGGWLVVSGRHMRGGFTVWSAALRKVSTKALKVEILVATATAIAAVKASGDSPCRSVVPHTTSSLQRVTHLNGACATRPVMLITVSSSAVCYAAQSHSSCWHRLCGMAFGRVCSPGRLPATSLMCQRVCLVWFPLSCHRDSVSCSWLACVVVVIVVSGWACRFCTPSSLTVEMLPCVR
jgi:hypothetical protein